jgi:type II secretory pathway component PulF
MMMLANGLKRLFLSLELSDFRSGRCDFYEQLSKAIENKEQLKTFLMEELKISRNRRTANSSRARALSLMVKKISAGDDYRISQILGAVMPREDRMMLSAVDASKDKPATLRALATALREQQEARSILWRAVVPPAILLPGVAGFSYVMATQSIPVIVKIAPPEVWTPYNQAVRTFAETVSNHGGSILLGVVLCVTLFSISLPRWTGSLRTRLEQVRPALGLLLMPVFPFLLPLSIYRDFQVSLMLTSLSVLLRSGMTLTDAIDQLARNTSPWMSAHLRKVRAHLQVSPTDYVPALAKGLMSPSLLAKVATTIRSNVQFDKVLIELGTKENVEIRNQIAKTAQGVNTVLLTAAGALVLFLYVGQLSITQSMASELDPNKKLMRSLQ